MSRTQRAFARRPVRRELLAGTIEAYHEQFVAPHFERLDRRIAFLTRACEVLAAAVLGILAASVV